MGKQIVVCHLPVPRLGAKTAVSPVLFLPEGKKDLTPRIGPRNGDPCSVSRASVPRRGPSRHPLITSPKTILSKSVNFGELSAPLISRARRPAPRLLSGLMSARRPHSRFLPQAIVNSRQFLLV
ncbi:hypothetical protein MTP99_002152 [Tenebrio molitor]|nr:hypothetical protein MTP99_002152 [Tenebrio molitor]